MLTIRQNLCPPEKYPLKCPYTRTPGFLVIHNTANDAPAENEVAYMLGNTEEVSFHFAVDDREAVQGLPLDRNAWAAGDGMGPGNMQGIHIEICYSLSGGERFARSEANAAELCARLLKQYGWGLGKITKHQDYNGKYCPHRTLDLGWERFLQLVRDKYDKLEEDDMTKAEVEKIIADYLAGLGKKNASGWAEPAIADCKARGIMVGDGDGNFWPQSFVTRQELAQVAAKLAGLTDQDR